MVAPWMVAEARTGWSRIRAEVQRAERLPRGVTPSFLLDGDIGVVTGDLAETFDSARQAFDLTEASFTESILPSPAGTVRIIGGVSGSLESLIAGSVEPDRVIDVGWGVHPEYGVDIIYITKMYHAAAIRVPFREPLEKVMAEWAERVTIEACDDPAHNHAEFSESNSVSALFTVMMLGQKISVRDRVRPDRATRRAMAREHMPETEFSVFRLRRVDAGTVSSEGYAIEHDHRWWTRGHWRRVWCGPKKGPRWREPRWIDPYLNGPEDKPIAPMRSRFILGNR